ncbi:MAG: class I SAM-dependent methyltransferase [Evtepia gabavorous]
MGQVHQYLTDHLPWDGRGTLLDIGCGSGALTIRCAKRFPNASLVGVDYWGAAWSYAKGAVPAERRRRRGLPPGSLPKGDAAHLAFPDETFEAAVSNFVFHEVRTQPDKREVVREALRVVKKGGCFAFQDPL